MSHGGVSLTTWPSSSATLDVVEGYRNLEALPGERPLADTILAEQQVPGPTVVPLTRHEDRGEPAAQLAHWIRRGMPGKIHAPWSARREAWGNPPRRPSRTIAQ